jgi:hypothetical protein
VLVGHWSSLGVGFVAKEVYQEASALSFQQMSHRFRRSIRLAPGIRINLGLHGAGLSVGPRGLHVGVNRRGMYTSAGIPGTRLYAVHHIRRPAEQHPSVAGSATSFVAGIVVAVIVLAIAIVAYSSGHGRKSAPGWAAMPTELNDGSSAGARRAAGHIERLAMMMSSSPSDRPSISAVANS